MASWHRRLSTDIGGARRHVFEEFLAQRLLGAFQGNQQLLGLHFLINLMKTQQEEAVIEAVRDFDGELAQKIIDEMFLATVGEIVAQDIGGARRHVFEEFLAQRLLGAFQGAVWRKQARW
jgi:hypothetical protein